MNLDALILVQIHLQIFFKFSEDLITKPTQQFPFFLIFFLYPFHQLCNPCCCSRNNENFAGFLSQNPPRNPKEKIAKRENCIIEGVIFSFVGAENPKEKGVWGLKEMRERAFVLPENNAVESFGGWWR